MKARGASGPLRTAADTVTGLAIFILLAGVVSQACNGGIKVSDVYMGQAHAAHYIAHGSWVQPGAHIVPLAMVTGYPGKVYRNTGRTAALTVLAGVFTLLFAANMALFRHLRSQYSPPRRRRKGLPYRGELEL
jgi:hypothetical protein